MSSPRLRYLALVALVAMAAAACGRDDPSATTGAAAPTSTADASGSAPTTEPPTLGGLAAGEFGDLGTVCSAGDPTPVEGETGIDGTTIRLATFSDVGFAGRPGLNQELFDTAEAVVEWCNRLGGLRGYELALDLRDAALTEYQPRVIESCDANFAMVGGGAVFDDTGQEARLECGLPDFAGYVVTGAAAEADLVVQPVPNPVYELSIGDLIWIEDTYPESISKVGFFTGSLPTLTLVADRYQEAVADRGWETVYDNTYNVGGEANWKPFAQAMRDADVEILIWTGEPANLSALRQAMADIEYVPTVVRTDSNHYDDALIELGGEAIANTFVRNAFVPFDNLDNAATSDYAELMTTYAPGGKYPALLGAQGLSAWILFLTSAGDCIDNGTLTRDCVYATARAHDAWTGGGLHAPMNLVTGGATECFSVLEATPDGFEIVDVGADATGFACDPDFAVALTGDYGEGARCPSGVVDPLPSECS